MRLSLGGDAEIELASTDEIRAISDNAVSRIRAPHPKPRLKSNPASGVMPATGPLILDLGSPPAGSVWSIISVVVVGSDDRTAVPAGIAALYLGGEPSLNPSLMNLLEPGSTTIPVRWNYNPDMHFAHVGDSLYVLVYGAAAGLNIAAVSRYHEWMPASGREGTGI